VGYVYGDSTAGQAALYGVGLTGIPVVNVNNNCSTGSTALFLARQAVASGAVECALALGFEQMVPGALKGAWTTGPSPCERFADAMTAHQGYGRRGAARSAVLRRRGARLHRSSTASHGHLWPHLGQGAPACGAQPAGRVPPDGHAGRGDGLAHGV
jgi:acetyl-CoA acetyltransferase